MLILTYFLMLAKCSIIFVLCFFTSLSQVCQLENCLNGGSCPNAPYGQTACICPSQFSGVFCENDVCKGFNCGVGTCSYNKDTDGPECICPAFVSGPKCEYNPCVSKICKANSVCTLDTAGQAICTCDPSDLVSTDCFRPDCSKLKCEHGGTCLPLLNGTVFCKCEPNFSGPTCANELSDYCSGTVAINKGYYTCSSNGNVLWSTDPCLQITCKNGGTCTLNSAGSPVCICLTGITGTYCTQSAVYHVLLSDPITTSTFSALISGLISQSETALTYSIAYTNLASTEVISATTDVCKTIQEAVLLSNIYTAANCVAKQFMQSDTNVIGQWSVQFTVITTPTFMTIVQAMLRSDTRVILANNPTRITIFNIKYDSYLSISFAT